MYCHSCRSRTAVAVLLLLFGSVAAQAARAASAAPEGYLATTLPNGLRISILPDDSHPIVATQVWYHVGSANEEPETRGFAHLFEHMMFGGTRQNPKRSYWDLHERYGGDNNAFTSLDETVYVSEIPPEGFARVLELEADRMVNLDLTQDNMDNEKRIVTEELRLGTENDPISRLFTLGLKQILGEHPYALTPAGTKEDIAAATLEHAREFYARYYRPKNAHVVIVGPVDGAAVLAAAKRELGPLPADGVTPPDVPAIDDWELPRETDLQEDLPPIEVAILGFPLPPAGAPGYWTYRVLLEALAGGQVDPVEEELVRHRRKALVGGVESFVFRRGGGIAFYSVSLPYRRKGTAFRLLEDTRRGLGDFAWLDEERLAAAKRKLQMNELGRAHWAASRASAIGEAAWWHGDEQLAFEAPERIAAVSLEDVQTAFRERVLDAAPVRVYVRAEHVPLWVRLFGWLYPLLRG